MGSVWCWLSSSMERVYKGSLPQPVHSIHLDLGRCDRGSFQANIRKDAGEPAPLTVEADAPDGIELRIRRVGYVPVPHFGTATEDDELEGIGHIPGFVPDPLFDDLDTLLPRNETATYWFSVYTSADTKPGTYPVRIRFLLDKEAIRRLDAVIRVYDLCIKPRENFRYAHWFYADALCDWYKVDPFDERF